jgi:uncharacterized damage-inducible protein DinB
MKEKLSELLEHSKNYTMTVAEAMPEKGYSFKPVETVWNFGELLNHIGYGIQWWEENYIKGKKMEWDPPVMPVSKQEIARYLEEAYASLQDTINTQKMDEKAIAGFHATLDHITHHRGQATIYLRCKSLVPPEYLY